MIFPELSHKINHNSSLLGIGTSMGKKIHNFADFVGKKIDNWHIISIFRNNYRDYYNVQCSCGFITSIPSYKIINKSIKLCKYCAPKKHGLYKTPTWNSWSGAKNRCRNPKNKDYDKYGGRGIDMCERWNLFENFVKDMGLKPSGLTLDRIDNNGNYEPKNCRWATMSQQNSNQRKRRSTLIKEEIV